MSDKKWWQKPTRYVQYNCQVKDAPLMDAERIAEQTLEMGAEAVVMNVAGVAAWYPSGVEFEYVNEHMDGRDMVRELLDACHARGLKFIARMDFMTGADETVFHQKPHWVYRQPDGSPTLIGEKRPGGWPLLYRICGNSGYALEEVALPVYREVADRFPDIDGFFLMGGFGGYCWCGTCREMYMKRYGKQMPDQLEALEPDWLAYVSSMNSKRYYQLISERFPDTPFIVYYLPYGIKNTLFRKHGDLSKLAGKMITTGNAVCTESQDVLSYGVGDLVSWNASSLAIKSGKFIDATEMVPIGIVHTCPGMDWRHVGIPRAEYLYWSAQVAANGGSFWASMTGVPDTNRDRRVVQYLKELNGMIAKTQTEMTDAVRDAKVLLLCGHDVSCQGWANVLMACHIEFDIMMGHHLLAERLTAYSMIIAVQGFDYPAGCEELFEGFVHRGGQLIAEGTDGQSLMPLKNLLGVARPISQSEPLTSTYLRLEPTAGFMTAALGDTELVPLRGRVGFSEAKEGVETLLTWVPPFAPVDVAGMPPERASLPAERTNVPLCLFNRVGAGQILYFAFEAGKLVTEYELGDYYSLLGAALEFMLGTKHDCRITAPGEVITTIFRKPDRVLVHFVNGLGKRPLKQPTPLSGIRCDMDLQPGEQIRNVTAVIGERPVQYTVTHGVLSFELPELEIWEMIRIELETTPASHESN